MLQTSFKVCVSAQNCKYSHCYYIHPDINDVIICYDFFRFNECKFNNKCKYLHINRTNLSTKFIDNVDYEIDEKRYFINEARIKRKRKLKKDIYNKKQKVNKLTSELFILKFKFNIVLRELKDNKRNFNLVHIELKKHFIYKHKMAKLNNILLTQQYIKLFNIVIKEIKMRHIDILKIKYELYKTLLT